MGCGSYQAECVGVAVAYIARHIEHSQQASVIGQDGSRCAGQELMGLQKVLSAMNLHPGAFGQSGSDGVGATMRFVPRRTQGQRHAGSLIEEQRITQCMHQRALFVRQHHDVLKVTYLLK